SSSPIHIYHCLCTHLVVATTTSLPSLARRSESSMDRAYILPLPPPPPTHDDSDSDIDAKPSASTAKPPNTHYALLLSTVLNKKTQIVMRTDGFEKRYLQLCGRCRLPIGYQLDWGQYGGKEGRREDAVYLLPGGLVSTEDMARGKDMSGSIG
ncbi:uncharacterized protein BDZ99DRAFT_368853, partial [Mytilinidion resinicola]